MLDSLESFFGNYYVYWTVNYFFLIYGIMLMTIYFSGVVLANRAIRRTKKKSTFLQVQDIVSATDIPSVTLVAPAYNEGMTIIENVKSLLSIQYPYYEFILVNDGSKDDSLEKLIKEFDLEQHDASFITQPIPTASVKSIYKSKNKKYTHLTVIDKNNGGRADALNTGINFADTELVICTDADCIIEQDALLKMVRPYLEEDEEEIIACGGGIGIANDSIVHNGVLKELKLPENLVPMVQVVEYIRAFLLGRMAWGEINGLMLVSGAFGMYPRKRVMEVGGFDSKTVGEDLELCIRLRIHMENLKKPYKVVYLPETLCWTEGPPDYDILIKQRDRWARGLWETMSLHRKLFFNPRYRHMGMLYYPYWLFFEFGAPLVEFLGMIVIILFGIFGWINWPFSLLLFFLVYLVGCLFSTAAIFMYVKNFDHYTKPKQIVELLLAAYLEPFLYHPVLVYGQMKGYYKKLFRIKSGWGAMTRKGFKVSDS
ncbi:glycosyltransferase family 2 protein [Christiangramia sabulilitoris]|uniref:Glycosyltransferase family 2 protein n=1 Tax=Christiangramia sabulilitoris TaxID=2583991 RepID=A0A550I7A9_9FLAO|nr:glycosyltransferase [Christiangramia sabulilitoris]TRO66856.1 glycosyltransferase family 2 protein [Christiangramia sabulilitoris]